MYKVDRIKNDVIKLEQKLFRELHLREREHLQEWIAKNPDILGEELLIIQKEYDGFNDTNERLDLLALDKDGNLVVIENKLDDSGRNVVWQALKYASYCSTLTTPQIIRLYKEFLEKEGSSANAQEVIMEFLEIEEAELLLNSADLRILFVANHYRKEVTSTVLWLLQHDIQIQCFKATPYSMQDEVFLQVEQIIPLPETAQFMIDAKQKEKEVKQKHQHNEERIERHIRFWGKLKEKLNKESCRYLDQITAKQYADLYFTKKGASYGYFIGRGTKFRVDLFFQDDSDKRKFDYLFSQKDSIEEAVGCALQWERQTNAKVSRIKLEADLGVTILEEENWPVIIDWYYQAMIDLFEGMDPFVEKMLKNI